MTSPEAGLPETVADGVRRVLAPNPSRMTLWGTNTWIVGEGNVAVIDPGPDDAAHAAAIRRSLRGETVTHILVTHAHADHSPLARRLSSEFSAPIVGFGAHDAGRSQIMRKLAASGTIQGGEGSDRAFLPGQFVSDGDLIAGDDWELEVLHTPGHFAGHLSFRLGDALFSGDHVLEWASSLVSPPDGDVADFIATSERLAAMNLRICHTGHGHSILDPADRLTTLVQHRRAREHAILGSLSRTGSTIDRITATVYIDTPVELIAAAKRNVLAHLIDLERRNLIRATPNVGVDSTYALL